MQKYSSCTFVHLIRSLISAECVCFLPFCYLAELGQPSLGPHNSQSRSAPDGCGLGPVHSRCICGGLIRTSTARTGRGTQQGEGTRGWGVQGGGQRYKPDQPFSWSAHKYLRGSYINSRPEEGIKAQRLKPRLLPHVGCTAPLIFIKYNRRSSDPSWGRGAAAVPKPGAAPPGGSRSASRSPSAESQPRWIKKKKTASTKANVCVR